MNGTTAKIFSDGPNRPIRNILGGTAPDYVIFREIDYDGNEGAVQYTSKDMRVTWNFLKTKGIADIDYLMQNINKYKNLKIKQDVKNKEPSYLDIAVRDPSHVIVSISGNLPWFFDGNDDRGAVTVGKAGDQDYIDKISNLRHLSDDGKTLVEKCGKNCKLVCFIVKQLDSSIGTGAISVQQSINFHVTDGGKTKLTIDPDIRYPGNTGLDIGDEQPTIISEANKQNSQ